MGAIGELFRCFFCLIYITWIVLLKKLHHVCRIWHSLGIPISVSSIHRDASWDSHGTFVHVFHDMTFTTCQWSAHPIPNCHFSEIICPVCVSGKREKKGSQEDSFLGHLDTDQVSSYVQVMQTPFRYKGVGLGS